MGHHHHRSVENLRSAFFLNFAFAIIELIGGFWTNSVAILSDALHDFGDSVTLGLAWYFAKLSGKASDKNFSFGYKRFSVLGALLSSIILLVGSAFIIIETIPRLLDPVQPDTGGMIILGIMGVLVNGAAAFRLKAGETLNEQAVFWHLMEDVLGWVVTLIGAIVMHFFDLPWIDPILSILVAGFILYNVKKNLVRGFKIILQGTPSNVQIDRVHKILMETDGVVDFHNCHVWSMDGQYHVLSVHLVVKEHSLDKLQLARLELKEKLTRLGIDHTTIEFELPDPSGDNPHEHE